MSKVLIDKSEYVLIEHRTTNEFGSVYDYKIYQVDNLDFKSIFVPKEEASIDTSITSIEDVKKSNLFVNPKFVGFYLQYILDKDITRDSKKTYVEKRWDNLK